MLDVLKPLEGNFSIPMKPYQFLGDVYAGAGLVGEADAVLALKLWSNYLSYSYSRSNQRRSKCWF